MTRAVSALILAVAMAGCAPEDHPAPIPGGDVSPTARLDVAHQLRLDMDTPRHPSDGGGVAWIVAEDEGPPSVVAGHPGRFELVYEAGPHGVAVGGAVYLLVSPFWEWSQPQVSQVELPGYTTATTEAEGVILEPQLVDSHLLAILVGGRTLANGETVNIVYGAGPAGAIADRYAEAASRLWIAVDGDGDGVRTILPDSPAVHVLAGNAARLVLTVPSVARPGESARLTVAVLDAVGNAGVDFEGTVKLSSDPPLHDLPTDLDLGWEDAGLKQLNVVPEAGGTYRIQGRIGEHIVARSNPMVVSKAGAQVYWGDLHGHSGLSDGTGTPGDYLAYARDAAALDVVALTDHDHWGIRFLDQSPDLWQEIRDATRQFHDPGRFVALLGYEWTSWVHGHRHVLYFGDDGEVLSSVDPEHDTPTKLWQGLRDAKALTFAHHSAGGPIATNWNFPPDPELEPVTEISSVHGSSEAPDSPHPVYSAVPGNFARDVLDRGFHLGFIGSGDSHDGHPGLAHLSSPTSGIAAIIADELSRDGVLAALKSRRVYASNGPRILLRMAVDGQPMGSVIAVAPGHRAMVFADAVTVETIEKIDLIRSGEVIASAAGEDRLEMQIAHDLEDVSPGEYVYLRVVQTDGGAAWSSPVFFVASESR